MPEPFFTRLESRARQIDSLLCVGLDPHPNQLASADPAAARDYCLHLIDACGQFACAVKPNIAFFEAMGPAGLEAVQQVIQAVPPEIPVILDAKRGDIASTANAYAKAIFDVLQADAVTASPYLGYDSVAPLAERDGHGVFVLCKTSNPGADEFQALPAGSGEPLYLAVAQAVQRWNTHNSLGLVAGATDPAALARVRVAAPDLWILAPGVGAQGGDLEAALAAGLRADGLGLLVTVSRSLASAPDPTAEAARLRSEINRARRSHHPRAAAQPDAFRLRRVADALLDAGCVRFGSFTLKSGQQSPIYLDLRLLPSRPDALREISLALLPILQSLSFDRLAAIPYGALPIGTALALAGRWPLIYPRREGKQYGTRVSVEGEFRPGETAVVLDDLITTGESKFEAIGQLSAAGLQIRDIVVLVDRGQDAAEKLAAAGYRLHALVTLQQLVDTWRTSGAISSQQHAEITSFMAQTSAA